jgi:capsular polysaccharide biosynthesis protein
MELRDYLNVIWRHKLIIVATALVTLIVVVVGTIMATPVYQASTILRVETAAEGSLDYVTYDTNYGDRLMNTYAEIITSGALMDQLKQRLDLARLPKISADVIANTELIRITVEDPDPVLAQKTANSLTELFVAYVRTSVSGSSKTDQQILGEQLAQFENDIIQTRKQSESLAAQTPADLATIATISESLRLKEDTYASLLTQYERVRASQSLRANSLSVIEAATVPEVPSAPHKESNIALGFLVGIAGGLGLAFLTDNWNRSAGTREHAVLDYPEALNQK